MSDERRTRKLFVIVDAFLDRSQQTVQACHAVGAFCLLDPQALEWNNTEIVIKKAKDFDHWRSLADVEFLESYWNRVTACAAYREEGYAAELPLI